MHGQNMPLDPRDVGPGYTGPLRFNDMVLTPEQEEKLRIKVDQDKGRETVEPSPKFEDIPLLSHFQVTGEAPAAAAQTAGKADPPPNPSLKKTDLPYDFKIKTEQLKSDNEAPNNKDVIFL